jgi:cell division protein ZapA
MNEQNPRSAVEIELRRLEKRLEDLIVTVGQIKDENRALRQRQETLTTERASLLRTGPRQGRSNDRPAEIDGASMTETHARVSVRILEKEYHITCPIEERSDLLDSAEFLNAKMREIRDGGKVVGLDRIAVIAALNMANELLRLRNRDSNLESDVGGRLRILRERVESTLEKGQQLEL